MPNAIKIAQLSNATQADSPQLFLSFRENGYALLGDCSLTKYLQYSIYNHSMGRASQNFSRDDNVSGFFPAKDKIVEHFILALSHLSDSVSITNTMEESRSILNSLGNSVNPNHRNQFSNLIDPPGTQQSTIVKTLKYTSKNKELEEHVDRGIMTIVVSNGKGLEGYDTRNEVWLGIPANVCVLLIGHTLEVASGGAFKATRHRVKVSKGEKRVSVAFQVRGRNDAKIKVEGQVPKGIRSKTGVKDGLTVVEVIRRFSAIHRSVTNHDELSSASDDTDSSESERGTVTESSERERENKDSNYSLVPFSGSSSISSRTRSSPSSSSSSSSSSSNGLSRFSSHKRIKVSPPPPLAPPKVATIKIVI